MMKNELLEKLLFTLLVIICCLSIINCIAAGVAWYWYFIIPIISVGLSLGLVYWVNNYEEDD